MNNQNGAIAVLTAILLLVFLGFVALAVDTGYLMAGKNELQNAADAAALAGAKALYINDGESVNPDANRVAYNTAMQNLSANTVVEVDADLDNNTGDIQRGHWSWGRGIVEKDFYPDTNNPLISEPYQIIGVSDADLDDEKDFINAVKVTVKRKDTPIKTFFAKILSVAFDSFEMSATAVAYLGFAGDFQPYEFDLPIVVCLESITEDGVLECNKARMINSGSNQATSNTAEWTGFDQTTCSSSGASTISGFIDTQNCLDSGNPDPIGPGTLNAGIGSGQGQSIFQDLYECWESVTNETTTWEVVLPVVECGGANAPNGCLELVGAVTLEIIWLVDQNDPHYNNAPYEMDDWVWDTDNAPNEDGTYDDGILRGDINEDGTIDGKDRWASFVDYFELVNANYYQKSIYAKPSCKMSEPTGATGGVNLGVLARSPVLVE